MAYQQSFKDDDEQKKQGQTGTEQVLATGQVASSNPDSTGSAQKAQAGPSSSGGWTNLEKFVTANEGNDAAMGNKIKSGIQSRANDATQAGNQYKQTADTNIEAGTVRDDGIIQQVSESPTSIMQNQWAGYTKQQEQPKDTTRRQQFDKQWDAYYSGPNAANSVQGYQDASQRYNQVDQRAQTAQTHDGRTALLNDEYARPDYTQGEKTLDSFVLGAGEQGRGVLNDINEQYSGFSKGWDDLVGQVDTGIQQGKDTTDATREGTRSATRGNISNHETKFDQYGNQLSEEAALWNQKYNNLTGKIGKGNYAAAGMDNDVAAWLAKNGLDATQLVNKNDGRSLGDLVTDEEEAAYGALTDLGRVTGPRYQDFTETGLGADDYFKLNGQAYGQGQQAYDIYSGLQSQADGLNAQRDREYQGIMSAFSPSGFAGGGKALTPEQAIEKLGITEQQYQWALQNNVNPLSFVKQNKGLTAGDVAKDSDRQAWAGLIPALSKYGFDGSKLLANSRGSQKAYDFDLDAFLASLPVGEVQSAGGTMSGRNPSSGGYVEQTRRKGEKVVDNVTSNLGNSSPF